MEVIKYEYQHKFQWMLENAEQIIKDLVELMSLYLWSCTIK